MADEQQLRQAYAGFWQLLAATCRRQPALLALDDVHWVDESSRGLLAFLLEQLAGLPLMLILLYRPGFQPQGSPELRASHTAVRLEPLSTEDSVELARSFLGAERLPADVEQLVSTRAEGNPFFIEELLQALLELGSLALVNGTAVLAAVDVDVPDTVQGTILARLDRLEPATRAALQHAAVIGRSFPTSLLETIMGGRDLAEPLGQLARAQLLMTSEPGQWSFKHSLIQEVAYDALLLRRRREIHLAVAKALELRGEADQGTLEAIAEQYAKGGAGDEAKRFALAAGDAARERMGYIEAKRCYETALRHWGEGDDEGRLALMSRLGSAALLAGDTAAARTTLIEAEEGWRRLGRPKEAGSALALLGRVYWISGDSHRATEVLDHAVATLVPLGPSVELAEAYNWASTSHMLMGILDDAQRLAEDGLVIAEELGLDGLRSSLLNTLGGSRSFAGDPAGIDMLREALRLGLEVDDPYAVGRGYTNLGSILGSLGQHREAVEVDEEGREAAHRLGAPVFEWFIAGNEAGSLVALGWYDQAEALLDLIAEQHAVVGATGVVNAGMMRLILLTRRGDLDAAQSLAEEIVPIARGIGGSEFFGQVLTAAGELEHARGHRAAARQLVRESVALALETPATEHWLRVLPPAARLLPPEESRIVLERVATVTSFPIADARREEATGVLTGDRTSSRRAAEMYAQLEMPYEEAQCRIECGELDRAREIVIRLGVERGPLGRALELS